MGLENDDFPFTFKTGVVASSSSAKQFSELFLSAMEASSDLFISNIFKEESLEKSLISLDQCFIPCDQSFSKKELPHICPLLNPSLLLRQCQQREAKLKFLAEYFVYLGLKRMAIEFNIKEHKQIGEILLKIASILKGPRIGLIILIPFVDNSLEYHSQLWRSMISFRKRLENDFHLELLLEIKSLPSEKAVNVVVMQWMERWLGQNIVYISFHQTLFSINLKGFPVLQTSSQKFLKKCLSCNISPMMSLKTVLSSKMMVNHFKYYAFSLQKLTQSMSQYDLKVQTLVDHLQVPLQPYRDNLEAQIYDIFEKDQYKYNQYEVAFLDALSSFNEPRMIICYYVGSGKGLILEKIIRAAKKLKKMIKVYCIQKNPFPLQTLRRRVARNKWTKMVQIVETDIRDYKMPENPDIIFSELLGGIGDNQLSPQCLKWAEKNSTKETFWIPQKYSTFIRPISTHILHKQLSKKEKQEYFTVYFSKFYSSFQSKKVWDFVHPLGEDSLERKGEVTWKVKEDFCIHGFQGSFDCELFGKGYFSIVPENKDKHFYSWFPLFFPFKEQQILKPQQSIKIELFRLSSPTKVWYEWRYSISDPEDTVRKQSQWHNKNGHFGIQLQISQIQK